MKITLIGSTRFIDTFHKLNREFTLVGHLVYSVAAVTTSEKGGISEHDKMILDLVHLQKILAADAVFLIDRPNISNHRTKSYIGESTRRELAWAAMNDKLIYDHDYYKEVIANATHRVQFGEIPF